MVEAWLVIEALQDHRVLRSLELALRDREILQGFRRLRGEGRRVHEAVLSLAEQFCLSEERIRTIVYRKDGRDEDAARE